MRKTYTIDRAWFTDSAPAAAPMDAIIKRLRRVTTRVLSQLW